MNADALLALAVKLERANSGSLHLTADVYEVLGHRVLRNANPNGIAWRWFNTDGGRWNAMRDYTEDVESAEKLVAATDAWTVSRLATVGDYWAAVAGPDEDTEDGFVASAKTAALALRAKAAALRVRP